jgi:hypothetical protein
MQPFISELGRQKEFGSGWERLGLGGWDCAYAELIPYRGFLPPRNFSLPPPSYKPNKSRKKKDVPTEGGEGKGRISTQETRVRAERC